MRFRRFVLCSFTAAALALPVLGNRASAETRPADVPERADLSLKTQASRPFRRPFATDLDARVLATLLASTTRSDFAVTVRSTEIACTGATCNVALSVKLPDDSAPTRMAFAVAGPKGVLSDVRHAECLTSLCNVTLIVERGRNTIAVGVSNEMMQTTGFATASVNAAPNLALGKREKAEWF